MLYRSCPILIPCLPTYHFFTYNHSIFSAKKSFFSTLFLCLHLFSLFLKFCLNHFSLFFRRSFYPQSLLDLSFYLSCYFLSHFFILLYKQQKVLLLRVNFIGISFILPVPIFFLPFSFFLNNRSLFYHVYLLSIFP